MNVLIFVEELACSGEVSLSNCSKRTLQRWTKVINDYLEANNYDWRVKANTERNTIEVEE